MSIELTIHTTIKISRTSDWLEQS